jgi:hypothetical protein
MAVKERWLVDENGDSVAVVLDIAEYNKIVEELEELEDIRAFDEAKASGEKPIPIEQAMPEMERHRRDIV